MDGKINQHGLTDGVRICCTCWVETFLIYSRLCLQLREVRSLVDYTRTLQEGLVPGLGRVTIYGGKYDAEDGKRKDLQDLYK